MFTLLIRCGNFNFIISKISINNVEVDLLENPINIFVKVYGLKTLFVNLLIKRFETFKSFFFNKNQLLYIFHFINIYNPTNLPIQELYLYNIMLLDYASNYRTYRHIFNLPVNGQRTWSNAKSLKIQSSQLYNFKFKKFNKLTNWTHTLFLAEMVNILWKSQWYHEWYCSFKYQDKLPWYVKSKKRFVGASIMASRRIESFFKHPYKFQKKKSHRKKKTINKNVLTTGFKIGFTLENAKNLF